MNSRDYEQHEILYYAHETLKGYIFYGTMLELTTTKITTHEIPCNVFTTPFSFNTHLH